MFSYSLNYVILHTTQSGNVKVASRLLHSCMSMHITCHVALPNRIEPQVMTLPCILYNDLFVSHVIKYVIT
jgi:hypothetical protein